MRNWLHRMIDHPGWGALVIWWCLPVWLAAWSEGHTPGYWIATGFSLLGLVFLLCTVERQSNDA